MISLTATEIQYIFSNNSRGPSQYEYILPVKDPHYKDKTVSRQSYLYNRNRHTGKDGVYIETGPSTHNASYLHFSITRRVLNFAL